jgi:hypothetical protein
MLACRLGGAAGYPAAGRRLTMLSHLPGQWARMSAVTATVPPDWSPADNPHAIAISEAQWWQRAVHLAVLRLQEPDDQRISWFSSRQIDARQLVFALRQILIAERLVAAAMKTRGVDAAAHDALAHARQRFEDALPGIKYMRDALTHFDHWSRGAGHGPQKDRRDAGEALRDVAREYWGFGYDPTVGTVSLGPYTIQVERADQAAKDLSWAIYQAAREVDQANAGELLSRTVEVLNSAGISCSSTSSDDVSLCVRVKDDSRAWLSLTAVGQNRPERRELSQQIVSALANAGLRLVSIRQAENLEPAERLLQGEALYVELDASGGR